jgi:hypothetical protein
MELTLKRVLFFARRLQDCDPMCVILLVLIDLQVDTHRDGFSYLKYAIERYYREPGHLQKDIYPAVAEKYSVEINSAQMDTAIRKVIEEAWKRRDERIWSCYFRPDRNGKVRKPSNAEFIARIAIFVELWQGCCKGASVCRTRE